ncbi:hypothetical protein GCM10025868_03100 [Angustibacter aerolatus]|uniref:Uncharacterized protein n=1 Tax=Angustibacter aerolatus TaxID=1162965 RepID=A0ABQ6JE00_9ACTN|nr:hypothetical protein GCM10025868_03100 [Angustibacter aerolatus]
MVAHALDDRGGAGVAHAEPLPRQAAHEHAAGGGAVRDHVAGDHVLLGDEGALVLRADDEPAAGQPLAEVVVGVAEQPQRDAARHEGPERLAGRAGERDVDRALGQPLRVPLGHLVAEHRADGAVHVAHRQRDAHRLGVLERVAAQRDRLVVERLLQAVVLPDDPMARGALGQPRVGEHRPQVEAGGLPVVDGAAGVEQVDAADGLVDAAQPERGQVLAHLGGDVLEERLDELRLAAEPLAQAAGSAWRRRPGRCRGGRRAS